jgi:hypothetical protein
MSALRAACLAAFALGLLAGCRSAPVAADAGVTTRWWRGNTHTHTLWSDGDHFPEAVAEWYKQNGYQFLAITDHNVLPTGNRWLAIPDSGPAREAYRKLSAAFGSSWVETRTTRDTLWVRLKSFPQYRERVEQPGRFILVSGEEITQYHARKGAHMNGLNHVRTVGEQTGSSFAEIFQKDLDSLRAQERETGREVVAVLNHPNFLWSQTASDILALPDLRFFEIYNAHPLVHNRGDSLHPSTERLWDIVLTERLTSGRRLMYGVATDDAHDYHTFASHLRNPGRGWIMVRSAALDPDSLMRAMERGDFYASTGVTLRDLTRSDRELRLTIAGEPGVTYTTQFIGTRRGWDRRTIAIFDSAGTPLTPRYGADVGAVLAEVQGTTVAFTMGGDELYVRARITSSKPKANAAFPNEVEIAWTQPVQP